MPDYEQEDKTPFHAEQELLGDMLIDSRCLIDCIAVTEQDFEDPRHRAIFKAVSELIGEGMSNDAALILERMKAHGTYDSNYLSYICQLQMVTPSAANAAFHAEVVVKNAAARRMAALHNSAMTTEQMLAEIESIKQKLITAESKTKPQLPIISGEQVEDKETEFLFEPYIVVGKLNMMAADPGQGKTSLACYMIARVTKGEDMEGKKVRNPENVLVLSVEDDLSQLKAKIADSGGDVSRVKFFDQQAFYANNKNGNAITFNDPTIDATVRAYNIKLIVFDPFQSFLGAGVDMNQANKTRPVLAALQSMAEANNCAVLILSHQAKGNQRTALMRSLGSVDIVGAMRSVLSVGDNPDNPSEKICVHIKANNSRKGSSFSYEIVAPRGGVEWRGFTEHTAEDLDRAVVRKKAGIAYDDEPVVAVLRKFITDNPEGGFLAWNSFHEVSERLLGFRISDTVTLRAKLESIAPEIARKDRIRVELMTKRPKRYRFNGEYQNPETKYSKPGVDIHRIEIPTDFQTYINDD